MRAILTVIWIAAACGGEGIALQITSDEAIDRVELFIVNEQCVANGVPCSAGVGWQTTLTPPPGAVLYLADDKVIETTMIDGDGTALLGLEVVNESFQPHAIALVGFRGDQPVAATTLRDIRIPTSRQEIWKVHLSKAGVATDDLATPASTDPVVRVHRWARRNHDPGYAGCLAFQSWDASKLTWRSDYFVPKSDPDCDDQLVECDAHWFDRNVGATAYCVTDTDVGAPVGCMVGTMPCADGTSSSTTCTRDPSIPNICLADELCEKCRDTASVSACAIEEVMTNSSLLAYRCELTPEATPNETPCAQILNSVTLDLPSGCYGGSLHAADDPLGVESASETVMLGDVTLKLTWYDDGNRCNVAVSWISGASVMNPGGYIVLDIFYYLRHVLLPIEIRFASPEQCGDVDRKTPCEPRGTPADEVAEGCRA